MSSSSSSIFGTLDTSAGINFTGLSSGIDTDSIVAKLLEVDRLPEMQISQQEALVTQRKSLIQGISTQLLALQRAAQALNDPTEYTKVPQVASSNTQAVGASLTPGVANPIAGGYSVDVTQLAHNGVSSQSSGMTTTGGADTLRLTLNRWNGTNAYDISVSAGSSMQDIANAINQANIDGVSADVANGQLRISAAGDLTVSDGDTSNGYDLATALGMTQTQAHQQATFTIDGTTYTRDSNSGISDALSGVTMNLAGLGSSTITVSNPGLNADDIVSKVKSFVNAYNAVQDSIRSAVTEKQVIPPQTDADRLKGALQNDQTLITVSTALRESMMNTVGGQPSTFDLFSQIGISTGASTGSFVQSSTTGDLTLDETALRNAIASNPSDVQNLLGKVGIMPNGSDSGLGNRLSLAIAPYITAGAAGSTGILGSKMSGYDDQLKSLQDRYNVIEQAAQQNQTINKAKFLAMETLITSLQQGAQALSGFSSSSGG
jgi:flagellar hook-associated protein 2